ncbi:oxysterol-binding protein [Plakobranchus ocellatus]|uniref:Oxysterol-binding protein n=1 Tax=Plakobranchus ocellatus TaxID=259542 RepID=A0AAV3Y955_9GAST|nr:oxysterol-binding protein [Plakobranchus ocellatus]
MFSDADRFLSILRNSPQSMGVASHSSANEAVKPKTSKASSPHRDVEPVSENHHMDEAQTRQGRSEASTPTPPTSASDVHRHPRRIQKTPPLRKSRYANSVLYDMDPYDSGGAGGVGEYPEGGRGQQSRQQQQQQQQQEQQRERRYHHHYHHHPGTKMQLDPRVLLGSSSEHAPPLIYVESCLLGEFEAKEEAKIQKAKAATCSSSRTKPAPMEGQILKFTNVVKGYQYRWFVLDPDSGMLEYFEKEEHKKQRPRGSVHLAAAVVSPSEEDSQTFIVNAANGEIFKLRASDARERQLWVDGIRSTAEYHTANFAQQNSPQQKPVSHVTRGKDSFRKAKGSHESLHILKRSPRDDSFQEVREFYLEAEDYSRHLDDKIAALPTTGSYMNSLDTDLLLLKATSSATLQCIQECINILQIADVQKNSSPKSLTLSKVETAAKKLNTVPSDPDGLLPDAEDEVVDEAVYADQELEGVEEHKSIILHLLSQLKLGMDLTKVVLPTFILERRSLLEMFADCMAHPDAFLKIPDIPDPEGRMLAILEWYLSSFHIGRQGCIAKKPYNPIIGETFHCSWHVKDKEEQDVRLIYTAEQVSHHPPVSAFYFECPSKKMKMNASIYTKSKFMGMSIGVSMVGKVRLWLEELEEEYVFGMPSAYARSILTVPWVELGDKVSLVCDKTGFAANIVFHTKPFYGGKLHRITAEAKNSKTGEIICKVGGEWNTTMEFVYPKNPAANKIMDVKTLPVYRKYVRPLSKQKEHESRKLWQHVTKALSLGDVATATEHKTMLEAIQREGEKHRRESFTNYSAKFFKKIEGTWISKHLPDDFGLH